MRSYIIYCPHLNRDIRGLINVVPNTQIWTGLQTPKGEDGCLDCHQAIVREARYHNLPYVFVMEDDCQFTQHFSWERWCRDAAWADQHGYGAMAGGCVQVHNPSVVRDQSWADRGDNGGLMVEMDSFHSAHCMVYFARAYDQILKTVQPFDVSIGQQGVKCVMTYPFVAVQRPVFSGILQRDVNYVPLYEQYEGHLGRHLGIRA